MIPIPMAQQIQRLVADLPLELVVDLATALQEVGNGRWSQIQARMVQTTNQPGIKQKVNDLVIYWQQSYPDVAVDSVVLAMLTAAQVAEHYRQIQQLEIVWTGPDSQIIPLRQTNQALLELIDSAQISLHIVSFAVYRVEHIAKALVRAAERGVAIAIYLETPDASQGRMSLDTVRALGDAVTRRATVYVWPKEQRPLTTDGKSGSLHAKIALADGRLLLVSSANLTGHAMTLNMEMGVKMKGGDAPKQVETHLLRLIERGVFKQI